jgi:biopolymer transport protein ExbD
MKRNHLILKSGAGEPFNLTAMIDVVFLLIIFFMLVCQFIAQENYELVIPDDCGGAVVETLDEDAVTVSVFGGDDGEVIYAVRAKTFEASQLANAIALETDKKREGLVHLRADKGLKYRDVQKALQALSEAGVSRVQLAAFREGQGE